MILKWLLGKFVFSSAPDWAEADYKFELPFPPSVNGYWRTCGKRQIICQRGREYKVDVFKAMSRQKLADIRINERLDVCLVLHPPRQVDFDVDNYFKSTLDAISGSGFWGDDGQIDRLQSVRGAKIKGGKLLVYVKILNKSKQSTGVLCL